MPADDAASADKLRTTIFLDKDLRRRLKVAAAGSDNPETNSMTGIITTAVNEYFDRHPELEPAPR
ncbi:hypothetical protein B7435_26060 [Mycolicibacterium peregrinum]|uniref:hypothetical protein n=1 Tax=Mycolicibacterium peregrinum TaxID=43304 RepID=UPI000B4A56B4|nr:hypothetical protein [Mycolicibacterium peregrinum]OWL98135.1 hypothetical protein B7435_26060 [Mycolicibacterium peregrinum]